MRVNVSRLDCLRAEAVSGYQEAWGCSRRACMQVAEQQQEVDGREKGLDARDAALQEKAAQLDSLQGELREGAPAL